MSDDVDFIEVYPNALPAELCDELISVFENHQGVYQGRTGGGVDVAKKNSRDLMLDAHPELQTLREALAGYTYNGIQRYFAKYSLALMGALAVNLQSDDGKSEALSPENFDVLGKPRLADIISYLYRSGTVNVQCYEKSVGGYTHWHSEQYPQLQGVDALHRVALYMFYLNDVNEGGETEFYYQKKAIQPIKGTMVVAPAGFTHSHRGNIPISNDKYIATSWVMFNLAEKIYAQV